MDFQCDPMLQDAVLLLQTASRGRMKFLKVAIALVRRICQWHLSYCRMCLAKYRAMGQARFSLRHPLSLWLEKLLIVIVLGTENSKFGKERMAIIRLLINFVNWGFLLV